MATVAELSEPYRNHLIPVLPAGRGVCCVCWREAHPDFRLCFQCNAARNEFRHRLADVVAPIALAVKREQLAHELWHYKNDLDPIVRSRLETRLAAVLWRFLSEHEAHVAKAAQVKAFDIVTTVPGTRERDGQHPLERIVSTIVGQTRDRYESLLTVAQGGATRTPTAHRYRAARTLNNAPAVLLIDDTWTSGANAQSATLALRAAGAAKVAVVVIGRHFDRDFRDCESYYQQAKATRFTWDSCCLERQVAGRGA